jgi:hypothetical protein
VTGDVDITVQNDHAASQKKYVRLLEQELRNRRKETLEDAALMEAMDDVLAAVYCQDHKRTNTASALARGDQLFTSLKEGEIAKKDEWGDNSVTALIRMCCKQFGHRAHPYELGRGVFDFPEWLEAKHPTFKWAGLLTVVGNRNDVYFENAMTVHYMGDKYLEYVFYLEQHSKEPLNKLALALKRNLGKTKLRAAVHARGLWWVSVLQIWRSAANSNKMGLKFLDMEGYMEAIEQAMLKTGEDGNAAPKYLTRYKKIFKTASEKSVLDILDKVVEDYRRRNDVAVEAVLKLPSDQKGLGMLADCLRMQAVPGLDKFRHFASSQLKSQVANCGKKDYMAKSLVVAGLTPAEKEKYKKAPATNRRAERGFSLYDRMFRMFPNSSHYTLSGLASANENGVVKWLRAMIAEGHWVEVDLLLKFALRRSNTKKKEDKAELKEQHAQHLADGEALRVKALAAEERKIRAWLLSEAVEPVLIVSEFSAAFFAIGREKTVTKRRKWLEGQRILMERRGVAKKDLLESRKHKDPDDLYFALKAVLAKEVAGELELVEKSKRPQSPLATKQPADQDEMTVVMQELLAKEAERKMTLYLKVWDQLADEAGDRAVIASEATTKTIKAKSAALKSAKKSKGHVEEKEAKYEPESELDESEGDEEEEMCDYDLKVAMKKSLQDTTGKPPRSARLRGVGPTLHGL